MNLELLAFLLPWLGLLLKTANGAHHFTSHFQNRSNNSMENSNKRNQTHRERSNLAVLSRNSWQICGSDWDTDDRLVCRHRLLTGKAAARQGWSVYCPLQTEWKSSLSQNGGGCYATPHEDICAAFGYHYVGRICDFPHHPRPGEDSLSNQSNEPNIDPGGFAYLSIAIFIVAFLFPCILGICCFYWGEDAEHHEEQTTLEDAEPGMTRMISNDSTDISEAVIQGTEEMDPPSYEACNETADIHDEGVQSNGNTIIKDDKV